MGWGHQNYEGEHHKHLDHSLSSPAKTTVTIIEFYGSYKYRIFLTVQIFLKRVYHNDAIAKLFLLVLSSVISNQSLK